VRDREKKQYNKKVTKVLYFPYLGKPPLGRFDPKVARWVWVMSAT